MRPVIAQFRSVVTFRYPRRDSTFASVNRHHWRPPLTVAKSIRKRAYPHRDPNADSHPPNG